MRSLRLSGGESGPYSEDVEEDDVDMANSDHAERDTSAEEDDRDDVDMADSDHAEEDDSHRDDIDERDDDDPSLSVTGRFVFSRARIPTEKKKSTARVVTHVQPV